MSTDVQVLTSTPLERVAALASAGVNANDVLNVLQSELRIDTDIELARLAGVSKATVSTWRRRNSIPFDLIIYWSLLGLIDLNYVLTRRGRLSGFTRPSESLDDPELASALEAAALQDVAPVSVDEADINRAASQLVERRQFYRDVLAEEHERANGLLSGRYVPFAIEILNGWRGRRPQQRRTRKPRT